MKRLLLPVVILSGMTLAVVADDIERDPINYSKATPNNSVSGMQASIDQGTTRLEYDPDYGYLKAVLKSFNVPLSSQVLVFSKTSLQRGHITPKTPRALYFNDDMYVGFCLHGSVIEISVADAHLGTVFYTIDQEKQAKPIIKRQTDSCLVCHASSYNHGLPGHLVRSVYPDHTGEPLLASGSYRTDQTSPFTERWGGWYVTGTHGKQQHLGNQIYHKRKEEEPGDKSACQNVTDLSKLFTVGLYPSPHSDIVALMVLEHQTMVHNRITRATLESQLAMHYQTDLNQALNEKPGTIFDSTRRRMDSLVEELLKSMLMAGELKFTEPVAGTSSFVKEFTQKGLRDKNGRSLRDFNLKTRLFTYPCSYLIYSKSFDDLPAIIRDPALKRLYDILTGKDQSASFAYLQPSDRQAILEILLETKLQLPAYWHQKQ